MKRNKFRKKIEKPIVLEQWIEVKRLEGQTVSQFFPSNAELEKELLDMDPQPTLIYRRLNFIHGVPNEYLWTHPSPSVRIRGGLFLHRMLPADWPEVMERERLQGANHHATASRRPQPRPEAYGPCPCADCTREREELDA
jgi:hypothetical protein